MSWQTLPKSDQFPEPPYFAVIFVSERSNSLDGYPEMDAATLEEAAKVEGYLGHISLGSEEKGMFISYWKSLESIDLWRKQSLHLTAKKMGRKQWYSRYISQISEVKHHSFK